MKTTTPFIDKLSNVCSIILIVLLFLFLTYLLIEYCVEYEAKKEYVKKLNEHDKSVIAEYNAQGKLFKIKNKNSEEFKKAQTELIKQKAEQLKIKNEKSNK